MSTSRDQTRSRLTRARLRLAALDAFHEIWLENSRERLHANIANASLDTVRQHTVMIANWRSELVALPIIMEQQKAEARRELTALIHKLEDDKLIRDAAKSSLVYQP